MFNRRASQTFRLSFSSKYRTLLGVTGIVMLGLYFTPKAAATTYHATAGHCQNNNSGSDVSWNFVLNPTATNPSTLIGTSNYTIEFAQGECFWSAFAPSGTHASSTSKLTIEHKFIYNSGEGGINPAGKAQITTPFGSILQHAPNVSGGTQVVYGPATTSWVIPSGTDLSTVQVDDIAGSGNLFTDSMEVDILQIYITN